MVYKGSKIYNSGAVLNIPLFNMVQLCFTAYINQIANAVYMFLNHCLDNLSVDDDNSIKTSFPSLNERTFAFLSK